MDFVKKEWQFRDIISENELNRMEDGIEEGITKAEQAQQIANEAKATADDVQSELSAHASATTGVHGATSAATPNTLVQRDSAGRFKAAAPSASDDVVRKAELDEHANRTDNPHGVTKSQVGLGNVQNYGIASQAQAQAGTANNVYMTPLRTKQAIDQFVPIETGIWTPELRFGESTSGITYQFRIARYTRIANVVYWTFEIELSSKGSASGTATIAGLPFADLSGFDFYHTVGRAINISIPSGQWLSSHIVGTTIYLATNTGSSLTNTEFANNSRIYASGFYFIS